MHTEHIRNLHPAWVVGGWLVAVAVTAVVFMVFVGTGLLGPVSPWAAVLVPLAVAVGFFTGGLFVGLRWSDAPVLHGAAITFTSVLVWFIGNLAFGESVQGWSGHETPTFVLGIVLLQLVASVAGGWTGRRMVVRSERPVDAR